MLHEEVKASIAAAGIQVVDEVKAAATANVDIATGGLIAVDEYTPSAGERILLPNQTDKTENGIYIAAVGAWSRATDFDAVHFPAIDKDDHRRASLHAARIQTGVDVEDVEAVFTVGREVMRKA